ncbi:hypothetical protein Ahadr17467_07890 [Anaerostipes hadrus ATCC 29173 = JCM 17467]|nr:hypothetical protein Ahadr17467_07890 [Anaerostipes hadrus ATCC 29173 = JCM 17467]
MWIRSFFLIFYGLCAGGLIAASFSGIFEYVRCDPEISRIDEEYEKRQNV